MRARKRCRGEAKIAPCRWLADTVRGVDGIAVHGRNVQSPRMVTCNEELMQTRHSRNDGTSCSSATYHLHQTYGIPMQMVGFNAKLLRDQAGSNLPITSNSITLGGGAQSNAVYQTGFEVRARLIGFAKRGSSTLEVCILHDHRGQPLVLHDIVRGGPWKGAAATERRYGFRNCRRARRPGSAFADGYSESVERDIASSAFH